MKLESGGVGGKKLVGYTKANWKDEFLGDIEMEAHSSGVAKGQFKLANVVDGVNVTASGNVNDVSLEANYSQDMLAATAKGTYNFGKSALAVSASGVVKVDTVSLGGQIDLDASGSPKDYNVGAQYAGKDLTVALYTSKTIDDITVSFFQKYSSKLGLGASMLVQPASGSRTFTFGTDYALDKSTGVKAKGDSNGVVAAAVSHTLADPSMKVGMSAQFDATGDDIFKAQKFGVSLSFGDF